MNDTAQPIAEGVLSFTIESRIVRELGERLVKQPEIALLELVKNSFDADATVCTVKYDFPNSIMVSDDGQGMTLAQFENGWMRIGTSSKENTAISATFERLITGEKGIGRFAVRFLGRRLRLTTVALDARRGFLTKLTAEFDWPEFDRNEDLGNVKVPYSLRMAPPGDVPGTVLHISDLRPDADRVDFRAIKTSAMTVVDPFHVLMRNPKKSKAKSAGAVEDPGFSLLIESGADDELKEPSDVAKEVLGSYVLRAVLETKGDSISLDIYKKGEIDPVHTITDRITNCVGSLYCDVRFFPHRGGTFVGLGVDGRRAKTWVKDHSGVAVFDRSFRVHPYGAKDDDWLRLSADKARNAREPQSSLAKKHFVMDEGTKNSTELNYMLRLPYPEQLVGVVQVEAQRANSANKTQGLIPAADREGFLHNAAFNQLRDLVRGAIEAIASTDRELQLEEKAKLLESTLAELRRETREAIKEIEGNSDISRSVKLSLVRSLTNTQTLAERHSEISEEREAALEVMSLLGIVAGFMTHEFGVAIDTLEQVHQRLEKIAQKDKSFKADAVFVAERMGTLQEFVKYSQGYIRGASQRPSKPYCVKPRIAQVVRVFGKYADDRRIDISVGVEPDLEAPLVPAALYNGIALNLYTNALKAVTAKSGNGKREIAFRAWNEGAVHFLEVSDTGIGIPNALKTRVFDPLFTTTSSNVDPLGSGMGLGLALVQRGVKAFGGRVDVVPPPPGFSTCFRVKLPISGQQ